MSGERRGRAKRIAAITAVRNGGIFLPKWIAHYGAAFGEENLFLFLDGEDQAAPAWSRANVTTLAYQKLPRAEGDRRRAARLSQKAQDLFEEGYDIVIATDIDEYIVVDPATGMDLATYLSASGESRSLSCLGLDVVQHLDHEGPIDPARPFLEQRGLAQISARYTKASVIFRPLRWGSGMHRIKGHNFRIDPNLFLIHTGMIDAAIAQVTGQDADRRAQGWSEHQARREALFRLIRQSAPVDGDKALAAARRHMSLFRPIYAWNKPGRLWGDAVIRLPERFRPLL